MVQLVCTYGQTHYVASCHVSDSRRSSEPPYLVPELSFDIVV